jgi:DNA-binding NtrC family response regulator
MFMVQDDLAIAVKGMQLGADHYLPKDCSDEELLLVVGRIIENVRLKRAHLFSEYQSQGEIFYIIGWSPALVKVIEQVDRVADVDSRC